MTRDLTEGKTLSLILSFSIPAWLGFLFQKFYTVVDTVIVGRFLGVEALAAVGCTGSVTFLLIGFCIGLCSGFAVPVSQRFGAKDYRLMRRYIVNLSYLSALFAIGMTVLTVLLSKRILIWMHTPSSILNQANTYMLVLFFGIPFTVLYNMTSCILRSLGDSRTPLFFLIFSAVVNIVLDVVFIAVLDFSVGGAAAATVISQALAGILSVFYMLKHFPILRIEKEEKGYDARLTKVLLSNGVPFGLQYSITSIGSILLQFSINGLGADTIAAVASACRIHDFFAATFDALGTTMASFAGQNAGAREYDRISRGMWSCSLIAIIFSVFSLIILYFFGSDLASLIVSRNNGEVLAMAWRFMVTGAIFYIPLGWVNIVRLGIQGMGYSRLAVFSGVFEMVARALVALLAVPRFGFSAVCLANPSAWVLADLFLFPAFYHTLSKLKRDADK